MCSAKITTTFLEPENKLFFARCLVFFYFFAYKYEVIKNRPVYIAAKKINFDKKKNDGYIGNDWDEILKSLFESENYARIREFLKQEYSLYTIYPSMLDIFNAFKMTPYKSIKAVILGQNPYHEPGQAHGLCFSVKDGTKLPPSLVNIYKELYSDLGIPPSKSGDLSKSARQGVLLLNTTPTLQLTFIRYDFGFFVIKVK